MKLKTTRASCLEVSTASTETPPSSCSEREDEGRSRAGRAGSGRRGRRPCRGRRLAAAPQSRRAAARRARRGGRPSSSAAASRRASPGRSRYGTAKAKSRRSVVAEPLRRLLGGVGAVEGRPAGRRAWLLVVRHELGVAGSTPTVPKMPPGHRVEEGPGQLGIGPVRELAIERCFQCVRITRSVAAGPSTLPQRGHRGGRRSGAAAPAARAHRAGCRASHASRIGPWPGA